MSGIQSIVRDWGTNPAIVRIDTTDTLATITTTGYLATQTVQIQAANSGPFDWNLTDYVLVYYSDNGGSWGFFTYIPSTSSLAAAATVPGSLSDTLPSADIFVGNASNVATGVAMTGDVHITNAGVTAIQSGAVTGAKIAANAVDFAQLALDVAANVTVNLTAAQIKGLFDTPVQIVAAPGAGKLILIDNILWDIAFVSAQYTAGGAIQAQYGSTVHGAGSPASASIAAATLNGVAASGFLANGSGSATLNAPATVENTAVFLSNATQDFATGDSTATLYIRYRIVTPA